MELPEPPPPPRRGWISSLQASFLTGLVVIAPIWLTAWLIGSLVGWIDSWILPFIPDSSNPAIWIREYTNFDFDIRGIGVGMFRRGHELVPGCRAGAVCATAAVRSGRIHGDSLRGRCAGA